VKQVESAMFMQCSFLENGKTLVHVTSNKRVPEKYLQVKQAC
jgi:hypothetical protein